MNVVLWDVIRDFFVQNVFGGYDSTGSAYFTNFGHFQTFIDGTRDDYAFYNGTELITEMFSFEGTNYYINISDWLSTIATLTTLILLVIVLALFVRWVFRMFSGLLSRA